MSATGNRVLVTVSGTIPSDVEEMIATQRRPRVDYLEMAKAFDADILDYSMAASCQGRLGRWVQRIAGRDVGLALQCFVRRKRYDVILTDGEQIGLPLALLASLTRRRCNPRHVMIVHVMSVRKKTAMYRVLRLGRRIDEMVVYSSAQRDYVHEVLRYPAHQIVLSPFMVDTNFFRPNAVATSTLNGHGLICAAGLEYRDYSTMLAAVDGLDVCVVIAAASPWSKRPDVLDGMTLPKNVQVVKLDLHQLRQLYADATMVVMPLHQVDFQAGVTTLLEAMSMAKPIICTRTTGQTDVITDGKTGIYVSPADSVALGAAIVSLLNEPDRAAELGSAAREWVRRSADIDVYVALLKARLELQLTQSCIS